MRTPPQPASVKLPSGGKLRVILPLLQMGLAALLLRLSFVYAVATRHHDMPGRHPGFLLLLVINYTAFLALQRLQPQPESPLWFGVVSVIIIGLLWYGIASWTLKYRERRTLFSPDRSWLRVSIDLLLIAMGGFLGWTVIWAYLYDPITIAPYILGGWLWFVPICILTIAWSVGLVLVFCYDLGKFIHSPSRRQRKRN